MALEILREEVKEIVRGTGVEDGDDRHSGFLVLKDFVRWERSLLWSR